MSTDDVEVDAAMIPEKSLGIFKSIAAVWLAAMIDPENNRLTDDPIPAVRVAGAITASKPRTSARYNSISEVDVCARMLPEIPTDMCRSIPVVELIPAIDPESDFGTFNIRSEVELWAKIKPVNSLRSLRSAPDVCVCATITGEKLISSNKTTLISEVFVCARTDPVRNLTTARSAPAVLLWATIDPDQLLDIMRSTAWVLDTADMDAVRERPTATSAPDVEDRQDIDASNKISSTAIKPIDDVVLTAAIDAGICLKIDRTGKAVCDTAEIAPATDLICPRLIELVEA
jgi:hypothetical protein